MFREDVVNKLRRNCILPPTGDGLTLAQHVRPRAAPWAGLAPAADTGACAPVFMVVARRQAVRTVIDGGHLCPLPQQVRPIYWQLDHTLRLYPLPNAVRCCLGSASYRAGD